MSPHFKQIDIDRGAVNFAVDICGIDKNRLSHILGISPSELDDFYNGKHDFPDHAQKILRAFTAMQSLLLSGYSAKRAEAWMSTPDPSLGYNTPHTLLYQGTEDSIRIVLSAVQQRIVH